MPRPAPGGVMTNAVQLRQEWLSLLEGEFQQPYMRELGAFLRAEKARGKEIYPPGKQLFAALDAVPPDEVKVVVLGQDPYHGPGQAHGLSFSVPRNQKVPPSLQNMFKELVDDVGINTPSHGDLSSWAAQGVLLLNSSLTVERGLAGSHQGRGWERFTDAVIGVVNRVAQPTVFLLWGAHAQRKGSGIDTLRHLVLTAPHPSPLSAHRGFLGCRHFSQANLFLASRQRSIIDWSVPP